MMRDGFRPSVPVFPALLSPDWLCEYDPERDTPGTLKMRGLPSYLKLCCEYANEFAASFRCLWKHLAAGRRF
jgi:hypothetical protein